MAKKKAPDADAKPAEPAEGAKPAKPRAGSSFRMPKVPVHIQTERRQGRIRVTAHLGAGSTGRQLGVLDLGKKEDQPWAIGQLLVDPLYRGQGIGRSLLRAGAQLVLALGDAIVSDGSPTLRALWEALSDLVELELGDAGSLLVRAKALDRP